MAVAIMPAYCIKLFYITQDIVFIFFEIQEFVNDPDPDLVFEKPYYLEPDKVPNLSIIAPDPVL
jgi:hypothetical protein